MSVIKLRKRERKRNINKTGINIDVLADFKPPHFDFTQLLIQYFSDIEICFSQVGTERLTPQN